MPRGKSRAAHKSSRVFSLGRLRLSSCLFGVTNGSKIRKEASLAVLKTELGTEKDDMGDNSHINRDFKSIVSSGTELQVTECGVSPQNVVGVAKTAKPGRKGKLQRGKASGLKKGPGNSKSVAPVDCRPEKSEKTIIGKQNED